MKQKCDKIVIKFVVIIFAVLTGLFVNVFSQYYYFSSGGNTYQQGCEEKLEIRVNTQGKDVNAGIFHLVLDPNTTNYSHSYLTEELRNFFSKGSAFIDWTAKTSPRWQEGSNQTILEADCTNGFSYYNGETGLYAEVNFQPVYSGNEYYILFGMEYDPDATTEQTSLGGGGLNITNSEQQILHKTGSFLVLQKPCVPDNDKPIITGISIADGSTKKSYLSGLTFSLKDDGGVNGIGNVPYVKTDGSPWTGNVGGIISNQYGIDQNSFKLQLSGHGNSITITNTTPGVSISWDGKTWENNGLNANVTVASGALFNFGIEKKITATFTFSDRAGNTGEYTINFNAPKGPELISRSASPANDAIYVNLSEPIKLGIKDDWAGVNSGTIEIKVYSVDGDIYGPYIFSGSDLNLSGVQGFANEPDYYITVSNHEKFPTSSTIKVEVYAKDMEGTVDRIDDYMFSTRPNCTEFQCCEPVLLDLGDDNITDYHNTGLIISGGNNPTFFVDSGNLTGTIDCNAKNDGLSVYNGLDIFAFFTDESELAILGTGIKGVLSGNVLILSYMVESSQIIIDNPEELEHLSGGDIDIQWHLTGVEDEETWLSGYIIQINGDNFTTGGFVDSTGIVESLPDGEYTVSIYPVDLGGHTGNQTEITFKVDTTGPDFEFANRSGYECESGYLEITGVFDDLSDIHLLPYSFDRIDWTGNNRVIINSQNITGLVSKTGYVRDSLDNTSEKFALYEFVDTGISVNFNNLDLGLLTGNYTTGIVGLLENFGAREGNCGITKLSLEIQSCDEKTVGTINESILSIIPAVYDETTGFCNLIISDDDGNIENVSISFAVDTKESSCALLVTGNQCTNGQVLLLLTGDSDISEYSWDNNYWMQWEQGIITGVYELGNYNLYVRDENGNNSGCNIEISTNILDTGSVGMAIIQATGYECEIITGYVQVDTGDTCGKNSLDKFSYNWNGGDGLTYDYSLSSNITTGYNVQLSVGDGAGNSVETGVRFEWINTGISVKDFTGSDAVGNSEQAINWKTLSEATDGLCGSGTVYFYGIKTDGQHGACTEGEGDTITYTPNILEEYEGNDSCIVEVVDDEGSTAEFTINWGGIDTEKPVCSVLYNESVCTSGDIQLVMIATGAEQYSWTGFDSMILNNSTYGIARNGIVTGYVKDAVGNTGYCTGYVQTFDNIAPIIIIPEVINLTGEECTLIEGNIEVVDSGGCGNEFNYSWIGFGSWDDEVYSGYSEFVTGETATVFVGDSAGNIANQILNYIWIDTGVQLVKGNEQIIMSVVLTGGNVYNTTTGDLINLFGAQEGNCGVKYISVEKISCVGLSLDIDGEGNVVIVGNDNFSETGNCILRFSDNDGNEEIGTLKIKVDTMAPRVELTGTNLACMNVDNFVVTGIFTEGVIGFTDTGVNVTNGYISDFVGEGSEYTWSINMDPMVEVEVTVPAGVSTDFNGTENTISNTLIGLYDNVGPDDVVFPNWQTTIFTTETTLIWNAVQDSGCADVSGYYYKFVNGDNCEGVEILGGFKSTTGLFVDNLSHNHTYTLCVQPVDNFGNKGIWKTGTFEVDLESIGCVIEESACSRTGVTLTLKPGDGVTGGVISLSWTGLNNMLIANSLTRQFTQQGLIVTGYIKQVINGIPKEASCTGIVTNIDKISPTITEVNIATGYECEMITGSIIMVDDGCGSGVDSYRYRWDGMTMVENNYYSIRRDTETGVIIYVTGYDAVHNTISTGVQFQRYDSGIVANNFTATGSVGNTGKTVNWKIESKVKDGACGSGTIEFSGFVYTGIKGECKVNDNNNEITYIPYGNRTGTDTCIIQVKDDEDSIKDIEIYFDGIDTEAPTCEISYQPDSCVSGNVVLTVISSEAIKQIMGGGVSWGISGNYATGNIVTNGIYTVEISDSVGNTGSCSGIINNINTGVLNKPKILTPIDGSYTNDNTLNITWESVASSGCRNESGYEVQILSLRTVVASGITDVSNWTSPQLDDGDYTIKVRTLDDLGGESEREEISITIDTEAPTCTIEFNQSCTSGDVKLTMHTQLADYYSWSGFSDNMFEYNGQENVSLDVNANGKYYCYVKDFAGNTGINSGVLNSIKTGVLLPPNNLSIIGGTPTNGSSIEFVWNDALSDGCREVSGYQVQVFLRGHKVSDDIITQTGFVFVPERDGEYNIKIRTHDTLGGDSEWTGLEFVVDTIAPNCSIEILTQQCTNSGVEIKLSGDVDDIVSYGWWNGVSGNFSNNIITIVGENGNYTGYVYDGAGNQGICVGVVGLDIQDQNTISYTTGDIIGYECEIITGYVQIFTGDSCAKDSLDKFTYLWDGGFTGSRYGIIVDNISGFSVNVSITDLVGNTASDVVNYIWQDTGVTLLSGENQSIGIITGEYSITKGNLIDLFDTQEGLCGKSKVAVTGGNCSGAINNMVDGLFTIIPNNNLDGVSGYCEFEFGDDEENYTVIGTLNFVVDKVTPELDLTGDVICAKGGRQWVITGMWSEIVEGFELSDIAVTNGTKGNTRLYDENPVYSWYVVTPIEGVGFTKVSIPVNSVVDNAGNNNSQEKSISWEYDNVGPDDVAFPNWQGTILATGTTLMWSTSNDSGCADVSGYYYKFVNGESCDVNIIASGFATGTSLDVSGLVHENIYTLCVQPIDNFGNTGNLVSRSFVVDLESIGCIIRESECSMTGVTLSLEPGEGLTGGIILLSWTGYDDMVTGNLQTMRVDTGGFVTGYIKQISGDVTKEAICTGIVTNIDRVSPTITEVSIATGYECEIITGSVVMIDDGCGSGVNLFKYQWNGGEQIGQNWYSDIMNIRGEKIQYVTGYDSVGNTTYTGVQFQWYDSGIVANNFTAIGDVGNTGKTVNWKILGEVFDGSCGSGTVYYNGVLFDGEKGTCIGNGEFITYKPNQDLTGNDSCTIEVIDDENTTGSITISWGGIDTEKPSCTLSIKDPLQCTSGPVLLELSSESYDVSGYSFDGENFGNIKTTSVTSLGIYTGYVIDGVGNVSEPCTVEVTGGVLDLDDPILETVDWIGSECSVGSITVTGTDNSCGITGLNYLWSWSGNTTNTNEIYSGKVGSQTVDVIVYDGVGHSTGKQVTYTWQNVSVTGHDFVVGNVGTGITVDWFEGGNISGGICELDEITASINNSLICRVDGHNVIYTPSEGLEGGEICTIVVTDGDSEGIEIKITFTGVDTKDPTVELLGGVGEQCTSTGMFVVTGMFNEDVKGVELNTLTGENVEVKLFAGTGSIYEWTVEMKGGTGKVWIDGGVVSDLWGNENVGSDELILGNYDVYSPDEVSLIRPKEGELSDSSSIFFGWSGVEDQGCAGGVEYILEICGDPMCHSTEQIHVSGTGEIVGSFENGTGYWRVISEDPYGNTGVSEIRSFVVNSDDPNCWIEEKPVCTEGNVSLIMTGDKNMDIIDSGGINWIGSGMYYTGEALENGRILVIVSDSAGHTGQCRVDVSMHDVEGPEVVQNVRNVNECNSLDMDIVARYTGCAGISGYYFGVQFGPGIWQQSSGLLIESEKIGRTGLEVQQIVAVMDILGHETIETGKVVVNNVVPSLLSGEYDLGLVTGIVDNIDVMYLLGAVEGNCGTGDLKLQLSGCTYAIGNLLDSMLEINPESDVEGNGSCELYVLDNELTSVTGYISYYVDTKAPECTISYSITEITNEDVVATLTCDGVQGEDWIVQNNSGENEYNFTGNGKFVFEYIDKNGNTGERPAEVNWIDKDSPICTGLIYDPEGGTSGDVRVTIDTGMCTENVIVMGEVMHVFTGNGSYTFEYHDEVGNTGELLAKVGSGEISCIDRDSPECEVVISPEGWTNNGVSLTMNVVGDAVKYRWNNDESSGNNYSLFVEDNGINTGYVMDAVGNVGYCTGFVEKIDKQRPSIMLEGTNIAGCTSGNTFKVTGRFSEEILGFTKDKISIISGSVSSFEELVPGEEYTWIVTMSGGECNLFVAENVVEDRAGNKNSGSNVLISNYDNEGPGNIVMFRPNTTSGVNYGSRLILQWDEVEDNGCIGLSGYIYKVCKNSSCNDVVASGSTRSTGAEIGGLQAGHTYYRWVYAEDNFGNKGPKATGQILVDLTNVGCRFEETACSRSGITLSLFIDGSGTHLSWTGFTDMTGVSQLDMLVEESGLHVTGYVYDERIGLTGLCEHTVANIDQINPVVTSIIQASGYECETITGSVEISDEGCGQGQYMYKWNGGNLTGNNKYSLYNSGSANVLIYVTGYDKVGNGVSTGVRFIWYNSPIEWNNFTGSDNVGNNTIIVNWRTMSHVRDGLCGNEDIEFIWFTNTGQKGECIRIGDEIKYTPNIGITGVDSCTIEIGDYEGSTGEIVVSFAGIDTLVPECTLLVQEGQQCTNSGVTLVLNSTENGVSYKFEGDDYFGSNTIKVVSELGIYTGYVKDIAGNIGVCTGMVNTGILDKNNPTLIVSNWSGYECSTGIVVVTGSDDSCGFENLYYGWEGFDNNTNRNEIYSGTVGSRIVNVMVFDGVGHIGTGVVTYIWNNISVTGQNFTVQNVGTGITVNWKTSGSVHAGDCEDVFISNIDNNKCTTGDNYELTYTPVQGQTGSDTCILTINDGDGDDTIVVTFEGIDTKKPTVQLQGGVGENCINDKIIIVTGLFSEPVQGVNLNILMGQNVDIKGIEVINGSTYQWIVEMMGGTGKVWIDTGVVVDLWGNRNEGSNELILGNYDNVGPSIVDLIAPLSGQTFTERTVIFEWSGSIDAGCSGLSGYILQICKDLACTNIVENIYTTNTGKELTLSENGNYYWIVMPVDVNGNTSVGVTGHFVIDSIAPICSISQSACSTGFVNLLLTGNKDISIVSGNVVWQQISSAMYSGKVDENIDVRAIVKDLHNQTGYCHLLVTHHDSAGPTFMFSNGEGNECETGSLIITGVNDNGGCAGLPVKPYKFGTGNWGTVSIYDIQAQQPGIVTVTGYVRDGLGNKSGHKATYTVKDVVPTAHDFSIGNVGRVGINISLSQFISASNAVEGNCGTGDLQYSGVKVNGRKGSCSINNNILTYVPSNGQQGTDSCTIQLKDNEKSVTDVIVTLNDIDTLAPVCEISQASCTSGMLMLTLTATEPINTPNGWSKISNTVYNLGVNSGDQINVVVTDFVGNTGTCSITPTHIDNIGPTFTFSNGEGNECETGKLSIVNVSDNGGCAGISTNAYKFGLGGWGGVYIYDIQAQEPGILAVTGYVRDNLGNIASKTATYTVKDVLPTAKGFTVSALTGISVNWKEMSEARDGACGNVTLRASVSGGTVGSCYISGDILSYVPNYDYETGSDICELTIFDNEGNILTGVKVVFTDINRYPYVKLLQPYDGKIVRDGEISLLWTGVGNNNVISGYVYRLWSATDKLVAEQKGTSVSLDLRAGSYKWNVYAIFVDGKTGGLSKTYTFHVVASGGSKSGDGVELKKDRCPDGDYSDSYYDGTCGKKWGTHGSSNDEDFCGIDSSNYSEEQKGAYLYSYEYGITTICPIQNANLDGYLIRSHFAKMISEFAVNVLGIKPEKGKYGCDKFNDIDGLNSELYNFVITSCELGLMGLEADGLTPAKSFNPDGYVTRAQFGTVLSRLLFGDTYNVKDESGVSSKKGFWYEKHLQALKDYGVMTKIDGDWPNYLERRGRVMIMLERADNYGIFAGKVPAKNGIESLFGE